jgi:hypothetical protein
MNPFEINDRPSEERVDIQRREYLGLEHVELIFISENVQTGLFIHIIFNRWPWLLKNPGIEILEEEVKGLGIVLRELNVLR